MQPTILLADDHPVTLNGINQYVASLGYRVLNLYTNGILAYNNILALRPDYAILDIAMPGMTGLEVLEKVRQHNQSVRIVLYTMYHDTALFQKAQTLGVNGYVLKDFALEELADCLDYLKHKRQWFSPRLGHTLVANNPAACSGPLQPLSVAEQKIVRLVATGKSSRQIAETLFISEKTVENHRSNIIRKLKLPQGPNVLMVWALQQLKSLVG